MGERGELRVSQCLGEGPAFDRCEPAAEGDGLKKGGIKGRMSDARDARRERDGGDGLSIEGAIRDAKESIRHDEIRRYHVIILVVVEATPISLLLQLKEQLLLVRLQQKGRMELLAFRLLLV